MPCPTVGTSLADLVLFDLIVFEQQWGRWGIGLVAQLPTARNDKTATEKWAIGPAIGFVASRPSLLWGLFSQNMFTVAGDDDRSDVDVSIIQSIIDYQMDGNTAGGSKGQIGKQPYLEKEKGVRFLVTP